MALSADDVSRGMASGRCWNAVSPVSSASSAGSDSSRSAASSRRPVVHRARWLGDDLAHLRRFDRQAARVKRPAERQRHGAGPRTS